MTRRKGLDPRAWMAWGLAASVPSMVGRNPWPLLVVLVAAVGVRLTWAPAMTGNRAWGPFVRLAVTFSAIGVLFNALTVRAGDRVLVRLPERLPLVGGALTANAALYGVLSGLALMILVLVGSTVGALIDWPAIARLLPDGLTSVAVAGSIAFAFVPQTTAAFREIREAQAARGHRFRGARDLLPIVVPTLAGGLERATTLAEALESRGFGGAAAGDRRGHDWGAYAGAVGLGAAALAAYAFAVEQLALAGGALAVAAGAVAGLLILREQPVVARTRYREPAWTWADSGVVAGAAVALVTSVATLAAAPAAFQYEPYPRIESPAIGLLGLAGLLGLLAPTLVAPSPEPSGSGT